MLVVMVEEIIHLVVIILLVVIIRLVEIIHLVAITHLVVHEDTITTTEAEIEVSSLCATDVEV